MAYVHPDIVDREVVQPRCFQPRLGRNGMRRRSTVVQRSHVFRIPRGQLVAAVELSAWTLGNAM